MLIGYARVHKGAETKRSSSTCSRPMWRSGRMQGSAPWRVWALPQNAPPSSFSAERPGRMEEREGSDLPGGPGLLLGVASARAVMEGF